MSFLDSRMDTRIEREATGGPFQPGRLKLYDNSGRLTQKFTNNLALHRFEVRLGVHTRSAAQSVLDLFYIVMFTPYEGFRFRDWRDYRLTQANSRLVLVSGSNYQIHRVHSFGGQEFLRPIYKPAAAVTVYDAGGNALTSTTNTTTGVVTVSSGTPLSCVGEFDVPVTFVDDEWVTELECGDGDLLVVSPTIKLEEIRL